LHWRDLTYQNALSSSQNKQSLSKVSVCYAMEAHTIRGEPAFVALGGIWLDEIVCTPGKETLFDVPGGSVAFGKRYFAPIEQ